MKLHILSDIHLEFGKWPAAIDVNAIEADISILAGDIAVGLEGLEWALKFNRPVIYVMGNHEFYGQRTMQELWEKARRKVAKTHVHLLENQSVVIAGIRFLGTTLWTDFSVLGTEYQSGYMDSAARDMEDYRSIFVSSRGRKMTEFGFHDKRMGDLLTPKQTLAMHQKGCEFLTSGLGITGARSWHKTIVVTHHAPSVLSLEGKKALNPIDAAYCSHLDHLVKRADLWIHGHTHVAADYRVGQGRVVSNPRGYTGIDTVAEFNPAYLIEV